MKFASATFIAVITAPTAFPAKAEDRKGTTLVGGAGPLARTGDGRGGEEEAHRAAGAVAAQAREKDAGRRRLEEPCDCEIEPPTCDKEFIDCVDGKEAGNPSRSCVEACEGECCAGDTASCDGFTGKVCPDGSCDDDYSCAGAHIDYVVNSCKGYFACVRAGRGAGGSVTSMVDSCNGRVSCGGVEASHIFDSCKGQNAACQNAKVDEIVESCNDDYACYDASIGGGTFCSCNGEKACLGGTTGDPLVQCCNGEKACLKSSFEECVDLCPASENPSEAPSTQPSEQASENPSEAPSTQPSEQASESQLPTWSHPKSKSEKSGKKSKQGKDGKGAKKDRSKRVKKVKAAKKAKMDLWAGVPADEWTMAALIQDEEGMAALADPDVGCLSFEHEDENEFVLD